MFYYHSQGKWNYCIVEYFVGGDRLMPKELIEALGGGKIAVVDDL